MNYKLYIITLSLCLFSFLAKGQDAVYSQFYADQLQLNPALTGLVAAPVVTLNYRNQWPNIPDAYTTFSAAYSQYLPRLHSGLGLRAEGDIAAGGLYTGVRIGLFYAYDIRFRDDLYIRLGLEGAFVNKRINWQKLIFLDQLNVATGTLNAQGTPNISNEKMLSNSNTYFDMSLGGVVNTKYFYAGFTAKHFNVPKERFIGSEEGNDELPVAFSFHAGSEFRLTRRNKIGTRAFLSPNVLFLKQQKFHQINVGAYLRYGIILGGIWFRHTFTNSDAVIFMAGIQKGIFKIAYSFDWTVSSLGMRTGGAHEIALLFNFGSNSSSSQNRYNDCLSLFR